MRNARAHKIQWSGSTVHSFTVNVTQIVSSVSKFHFYQYTTFKKAEKGWHTNKLHWNEAIWPSRGHGFIYNYVERTKSVKKVGDKSLDIFTFLIY